MGLPTIWVVLCRKGYPRYQGARSFEALRNNMRVNPDAGRKSRDPRNMLHILRAARSGKVTREKEKPGSSPGTATQQKGTEPGCV